jgi:RNA polymerase sigma factor (sigma-70 family)
MTTRSLHDLILYLRRTLRRPSDAGLSDGQLLERWAGERDQAAFELLLWRHGPMVLNTCRRLLRRREDVEDVFQATFLVLVRKANSIRRAESLAAWLHRVAYRIALRSRAASARRGGREQSLVDVPVAADTKEAATRDLRAVLDEEIDRLPSHYRRAVVLCCLEGKSQEEVARLLACPRGTVSSWLTRGRERLRQRLLRRGVDLSVVGLTAVAPDASAAALASLVAPLLRGAAAGGGIVPVGMMSAQTIALAEGMLRTMLLTKVKIAAVVLLLGGVFAAGVGTLSHSTQAADPQTEPRETKKTAKEFLMRSRIEREFSVNDGIAWGKAAHGLQAGIAFRPGDQESYMAGESVTFVVYLRNVSDKDIRLTHIEPLFEEWMPAVEDADGKRISIAHGPINLGVVPIVHRTVEPGERITLGHPWFRIRPVGWRGEILGPTCCAAPGRYKVGYAGWPLRLNDDKVDVSGPGTGQVELNIRQGDVPGEDRSGSRVPPRKKNVLPKPFFVDPHVPRDFQAAMIFMATRSFDLPFRVDPMTREIVGGFILYVSKDNGHTVEIADRKPPTAQRFHYQAPDDGIYWFVVGTESKEGRARPIDVPMDSPAIRIWVDTVRPEAKLQLVQRRKSMISVRWDVDDENLDKLSIQLEYQRIDDKEWTKLPIKPATEGHHDWNIPDDIEVWVRLRVRDKAGNESIATLCIPPEKRP